MECNKKAVLVGPNKQTLNSLIGKGWCQKKMLNSPKTFVSPFEETSLLEVPVWRGSSADLAAAELVPVAAVFGADTSSSVRFFLNLVSVIGKKKVQSKPYCLQC